MNRLVLLISTLLILTPFIPLKAQEKVIKEIKWYSFNKAVELNNKSGKKKKIFIDIYTNWCGWCKKMDLESFHDSAVIDIMNKFFIAVKFNAEGNDTVSYNGDSYVNPAPNSPRSTHQFAITLLKGQMSYPAFIFMNTDGTNISVIKGYRPPAEFIPILKYYGENIYLTKSWIEYQKTLNNSQ